MSKRRLKVSADTLLHHITVPKPDFKPAKTARKQLFMKAVEAKYAKSAPAAGGQFWRAGQGALVFAGVGLFVLIGVSSIIAMAGRAQPGDTLYSLNRAWERTQLALTQDEAAKLELKLAFAEERLAEASVVDLNDNNLSTEVLADTEQVLVEIDDEMDKAKLALEFGDQTGLSREDVSKLEAGLEQLAQTNEAKIAELGEAVISKDEENSELRRSLVGKIDSILSASLAGADDGGQGFYLDLQGSWLADSKQFETNHGYTLNLAGQLAEVSGVSGGWDAAGWLDDQTFTAEKMTHVSQIIFELSLDESEQVAFKANATLQQDGTGLWVGHGEDFRFDLQGEPVQDEQLAELVGQNIELTGTWQDGVVAVEQVSAKNKTGEDNIPESVEATEPNSETGESLPATDPEQPGVPPPGFDE